MQQVLNIGAVLQNVDWLILVHPIPEFDPVQVFVPAFHKQPVTLLQNPADPNTKHPDDPPDPPPLPLLGSVHV